MSNAPFEEWLDEPATYTPPAQSGWRQTGETTPTEIHGAFFPSEADNINGYSVEDSSELLAYLSIDTSPIPQTGGKITARGSTYTITKVNMWNQIKNFPHIIEVRAQ